MSTTSESHPIRLQGAYLRHAMGRAAAGVGFAVAASFALLGMAPLVWLGVGLAVAGLGVMGFGGRVTRVDPGRRMITLPEKVDFDYEDMSAVVLSTETQSVETQAGQQQVQSRRLLPVATGQDAERRARVERSRAVAEGLASGALEVGEAAAVERELEHLRPVLHGLGSLIAEGPQLGKIWQMGARLAEEIGLNFIDLCGERAMEQTPLELRMSLGERLRLRGLEPTKAGPAPSGLQVARADGQLQMRWVGPLWAAPAVLGLASGCGMLFAATQLRPWSLAATVLAGGCGGLILGLALLLLYRRGRHEVVVGPEVLTVVTPLRRRETALEEVGLLHAEATTHTRLHIGGPTTFHSLSMDEAQARWMRRTLALRLSASAGSA